MYRLLLLQKVLEILPHLPNTVAYKGEMQEVVEKIITQIQAARMDDQEPIAGLTKEKAKDNSTIAN